MHASQICESLLRLLLAVAGCISREEGCGGLCGFPQHVDDRLGNWWCELANLEALWSTLRPLLLHLRIQQKIRGEGRKGKRFADKPKGPNSWKIRHFWHKILAWRRSFVLPKWPDIERIGENNMDVGDTWLLDSDLLNNLIACDVLSPTFS